MGVFCDRLKLCSTAAPDCQTGQNKDRYREQELIPARLIAPVDSGIVFEVAFLCNCTFEGILPHCNQDRGNLSLFMAPLICYQK